MSLFLASFGSDHETSKHSEAHLRLDLHKVLWKGIHSGTNLSAHGDGIFGILQHLLCKYEGRNMKTTTHNIYTYMYTHVMYLFWSSYIYLAMVYTLQGMSECKMYMYILLMYTLHTQYVDIYTCTCTGRVIYKT